MPTNSPPKMGKSSPGQPVLKNPQDVLMNAPVGVFSTTPDGRYLYVNNTLAQMHGYDSPRQLMDSVTDIATKIYVNPADREELKFLLEKYGKVTNLECLLRHTNGSQFWVSENISVIKDENGNIIAYQGFNQDITERKKAEEELQESQEKYKLLIDNLNEGIWQIDQDANTVFVNNRMAEMLGYSVQEMQGRHLFDFMDEQEAQLTKSYIQRRKKGIKEQHEHALICKDGSYIFTSLETSPIYEKDGKYIGALAGVQDITERKQFEIELANERSFLSTILDNIQEAIIVCDQEGRIVRFNNAARTFHGIPEQSIPPEQWASYYDLYQKDGITPLPMQEIPLYRALQGEYFKNVEIVMAPKHKEQYIFSCSGKPLMDGREVTGAVVSMFDITDRKKAEDEIRLVNEKLERANTEKDKLFSIIAHDLKSPMAGIFNTTQILVQEAESLSLDDLRFISAEMNKSTENTLALLDDLMQWARMSQGGMVFSPEECCLYELARSSLYTVKDVAGKKNITIKCDIPQNLVVLVDQPMINTVIRNVIFNAVKFTNPDGNISVTARKSGSEVKVCVQDNGIGMDEAIISKIFSVDKSKIQFGTEGEKGTGLGLVLCKEFVEKHGGDIWLESEPGKGTKVCFTLPAAS